MLEVTQVEVQRCRRCLDIMRTPCIYVLWEIKVEFQRYTRGLDMIRIHCMLCWGDFVEL